MVPVTSVMPCPVDVNAVRCRKKAAGNVDNESGEESEVEESDDDRNDEDEEDVVDEEKTELDKEQEELLSKVDLSHLDSSQQKQVREVLKR